MSFVGAFLAIGGAGLDPLAWGEGAEGRNKCACPLGERGPTGTDPLEDVVNLFIQPDVPHGTPLANQADVTSDTFDSDLSNNGQTSEVIVQAVADLAILKTSDLDTYNPSATIKYTITVTNLGPSDSQAVKVFDDLPITKQA